MKNQSVTITMLARELKISPSTVSRALNGRPGIKEETRNAIRELATKRRYFPNLQAISFLHKKSNLICAIVPEISKYTFATILSGIQDVIADTPYQLIIYQSHDSYLEEVKITNKILGHRVDGVLIIPAQESKSVEHFKSLQRHEIPIVIINRECTGIKSDTVLVNDYLGTYQAVRYLLNQGLTKIAFISPSNRLTNFQNRLRGYRKALLDANLPVDNSYIINTVDNSVDEFLAKTQGLLQSSSRPQAILTQDDNYAFAAIQLIFSLGLSVPHDISILGYNDSPVSNYFRPALTTIWQPLYESGMLAVKILMRRIEGTEVQSEFRSEIFTPELVVRETTIASPVLVCP